jgi:hypothetical protein
VLAKGGFGLLENKRLRWFSQTGEYLGSVLSQDPIRRVYCSADAMVVETRQRRAIITGALPWWKMNLHYHVPGPQRRLLRSVPKPPPARRNWSS